MNEELTRGLVNGYLTISITSFYFCKAIHDFHLIFVKLYGKILFKESFFKYALNIL